MKKIFTFLLMCLLGAQLFAQSNSPAGSAKKTSVQEKITALDHVSGKRWKLTVYKRSGKESAIKSNDFFWFRPGGTFESALLSVWDGGSWVYDRETKSIRTSTKIAGSKIWNIIETSSRSLKIKSGIDELHFVPDLDIKTDALVTGMQKEISKTWKIAEHTQNGLKIFYKQNDFIRFHPDGNFEQAMMTIYSLGSWSFDSDTKSIIITRSGTASHWKILKFEDGVLLLSKNGGKETLTLK